MADSEYEEKRVVDELWNCELVDFEEEKEED